MNEEERRLEEADRRVVDWKLWGSYLSERAWGTVREDYSADGSAWDYFPFEHAHLRTYRWNEDGIAGICDRGQSICFAPAFWNGRDKILKERLFGLSGPNGNHGEDVKECYFYLDNTPTHSYMKYLYKYPQSEFPYDKLYSENLARDKSADEYELLDTGIFDSDEYFDIFIEYAKADAEDICIRITAANRSDNEAPLHILPTVWFRNTWSWEKGAARPVMRGSGDTRDGLSAIDIYREDAPKLTLRCAGELDLLFTENDTNFERLFNTVNPSPYTKDAFHRVVVEGIRDAANPELSGTKAAAAYRLLIPPGEQRQVHLRLRSEESEVKAETSTRKKFVADCEKVIESRKEEADAFYASIIPSNLSTDGRLVLRQSLAGMLWSKQYYHYVVESWIEGDPAFPAPPAERAKGRNAAWKHVYNEDVISMPDKWEYPWYAAWDLAFHCIPISLVDPAFAKRQLILLLREWYMHPNGQIPAYEWAFSDVNPPVHAWAAFRVYKIEQKTRGVADRKFLERVFHKLLLNFTWWVNRKDAEDNNVFEGGFLGLDNIGVFDRSEELPGGGYLEQSDGTSWMAMYCLNMMAIALELAREDNAYEDVASKFFEHFVFISDAMNNLGENQTELWNEEDGFYYDVLHMNGEQKPIRLCSLVGLIPLFAVETLEQEWLEELPDFRRRTQWFLDHRPDLTGDISCMQATGREGRKLLALVNKDRLRRVLTKMLNESEFLSDYGIRSLSRKHKVSPFSFAIGDSVQYVEYEPGESRTGMFGGNSNWRGPIWFPVNYLLIESLQKFDYFYGDDFRIEFPTGSGVEMTLWEVSQELEKRLCNIFLHTEDGERAFQGNNHKMRSDPYWRDHILFYEYFHGETGKGLGASHQTGWTGLIGKILKQVAEYSDDKV